MKRIGIITMYYNSENYGGIAQGFALQKYIENLGYDSEIISYQHKKRKIIEKNLLTYILNHANHIHVKIYIRLKSKVAKIILEKKIAPDLQKRKDAFAKSRELARHSKEYTDQTIKDCVGKYDVYVSGSDQIWKPGIANDAYLFNFLPNDSHVISYASSTAVSEFDDDYDSFMRRSLQKYRWISVREENAQNHFRTILSKEIDLVVDPTLLLGYEYWNAVADDYQTNTKYIFAYFLGDSTKQRKIVKKIAKDYGLEIVTLPHLGKSPRLSDVSFANIDLYDVNLFQFLGLIKNSSLVVTDSFHAVVFSNMFRKSFLVFEREVVNKKDQMNGRLDTILGMFGEKKRKVSDYKSACEALKMEIDYDEVHEILRGAAKESGEKLQRALEV